MLSEQLKDLFKVVSRQLRGPGKRSFMATVTQTYFKGSARQVEKIMGWSRLSVSKGLKELETGFVCIDNYQGRGRQKTEEKLPMLEADIRDLIDDKSQIDPTFRSTFCYARISARAVREALIQEKGIVTRTYRVVKPLAVC